jgi:ankyrin repeat protein
MPPSDLPKQILLDFEIDDAIPDAYNIALQTAAEKGRVDLVELLFKVDGINLNFAGGILKSSPLIIAAINDHSDVLQLLSTAMPQYDLPKQILLDLRIDSAIPDAYNIALQTVAMLGRADLVKLLLKVDNINPNFAGGIFKSAPLNLAAERGYSSDVVQLLLKIEGIDVNQQDRWGRTAFHQAVYHNNYQVVELLLTRDDIDPNRPDNKGQTALYYACTNSSDHPKMVDLLLKHDKVDPNVKAFMGITPVICAIICRHNSIACSLLMSRPDAVIDEDTLGKLNSLLSRLDFATLKKLTTFLFRPDFVIDYDPAILEELDLNCTHYPDNLTQCEGSASAGEAPSDRELN